MKTIYIYHGPNRSPEQVTEEELERREASRVQNMTLEQLRYIAPMACGERERKELIRRQSEKGINMNTIKSSGHTCFRCGKIIKGTMTYVVPSMLAVRVCGDFEKAYHPKCYQESEAEAAKELAGVVNRPGSE